MAEFSNYNGNDTYLTKLENWSNAALCHEVQVSSKPVSIANTENHIIEDGETKPVSNDFIYSMIFQQYISGVSTLVTWLYADIDYEFCRQNPKHAFLGNILLRPGNFATHAKVALDGMRLAPELQKFLQHSSEVAVLYTTTSILLNQDPYLTSIEKLYKNLVFYRLSAADALGTPISGRRVWQRQGALRRWRVQPFSGRAGRNGTVRGSRRQNHRR